MEVGPWRWDGKSEHEFWIKPGGWEEYATIVYGASFHASRIRCVQIFIIITVDQPAGTGFSYTSTDRYVHTVDIVSSDNYGFECCDNDQSSRCKLS